MKNANKRIIIYLVIVMALMIAAVAESRILKKKYEEMKSSEDKAYILTDAPDATETPPADKPMITDSSEPATQIISRSESAPKSFWSNAAKVYASGSSAESSTEEMLKIYDISPEITGDLNRFYTYWDLTNSAGFVRNDGLPDDLADDDSLCIVILGYALLPDGGMRDELKERLDEGLKAAEKYPGAYVLVTGGGTALRAPSVKEADKMAQYLEDEGLDPSRIIIENDSMTTAENAVLCEKLLREKYPEVKNIAIVTSDYHVPLGCQIFEGWFIMTGSELKVVSNASCHPGNPTVFGIKDQVFWMEELCNYLPQ